MNAKSALCAALLLLLCVAGAASASAEEAGLALGIVYDTSGSMREPVRDRAGAMIPKHVIGKRALEALITRLETFEIKSAPSPFEVGLFVFDGDTARAAVPFGPFRAGPLRDFAKSVAKPDGRTPLGLAVQNAGEQVLESRAGRRHVLVITDGVNTTGPDPAAVITQLNKQAETRKTAVSFHFIAFDVNGKVFSRVKRLGATVVEAADEPQLQERLEFILEEKILLEKEEPKK